jgi:hypothetical protein
MPTTAGIDFQKIREDSRQQCEQINALRDELRTLLSHNPQVEENLARPPPAPFTRPLLISRVDRIQSRLSLLASTLSPSNKSTPMSRPLSAETPLTIPPEHFPIGTPEFMLDDSASCDEEDALYGALSERVNPRIKSIEEIFDSKVRALNAEKQSIRQSQNKAVLEMTERERLNLESLLDELLHYNKSTLTTRKSSTELEKLRIRNEQEYHRVVQDAPGFSAITHEVKQLRSRLDELNYNDSVTVNGGITSCLDQSLKDYFQQVKDFYRFEISKLKNQLESQINHASDCDRMEVIRLEEENERLRNGLRRTRLAMAKWRFDYVSHATDKSSTSQNEPRPESVAVGDNVPNLLHTLGRMWTALPPSGQECIELLNRIHDAASTGGTITLGDIVKDECSRHVEKLPIAELAARREFLLAKRSLTFDEQNELREITPNLHSLISEYEHRHNQIFIFDGHEYLETIHRAHVRA